MVDVLARKRDGGELTGEEIAFFVREYAAGADRWGCARRTATPSCS